MPEDPEMAVAIKYDREADNAPRVVAKGMRLKAEKIKQIAKDYNVPIMRNVGLANALYRVDVGQEIPEELYDAVAEVLNFVFALQQQEKK
jgi:flagellar biosynthesis protein